MTAGTEFAATPGSMQAGSAAFASCPHQLSDQSVSCWLSAPYWATPPSWLNRMSAIARVVGLAPAAVVSPLTVLNQARACCGYSKNNAVLPARSNVLPVTSR